MDGSVNITREGLWRAVARACQRLFQGVMVEGRSCRGVLVSFRGDWKHLKESLPLSGW